MPFYKSLDQNSETDRRIIDGLIRLKTSLDEVIPVKKNDQNLLICTWNIREFGGKKYGGREIEPMFYIAEIISHFDLVAIQEIKDDLSQLEKLIRLLGGWWKFLVTDVTFGAQGNGERLAFVFDTRKVVAGGLVGEIQPEMVKVDGILQSNFSFARSPFMAGFRAGWYKFSICSDHFYYGESKPDDPQRVEESKRITNLLKQRAKSKDQWAKNIILLGDFNIFSLDDRTFKTIEEADFKIPEEIKGIYTNANKDKPFDQIAFLEEEGTDKIIIRKAGIFDFFKDVYRDSDEAIYLKQEADAGNTKKIKYSQYRTFKLSDHLPMWVELNTDFGKKYLENKLRPV